MLSPAAISHLPPSGTEPGSASPGRRSALNCAELADMPVAPISDV
ncbi:hypothetical protein ACFPRL_30520 [Pseudoclavibacter helvolus]